MAQNDVLHKFRTGYIFPEGRILSIYWSSSHLIIIFIGQLGSDNGPPMDSKQSFSKGEPVTSTIDWFEREGLIPIKSTPITHTITVCNEGFPLCQLWI